MASNTVASGVGPAITTHWIETEWEKSGLPLGTRNRLKKADRCIQAVQEMHMKLMADHLGKSDASLTGAEYVGLSPIDLDTMLVAMLELGDRAAEMIAEVRENELGFNAA